jgi:hypothetical protein
LPISLAPAALHGVRKADGHVHGNGGSIFAMLEHGSKVGKHRHGRLALPRLCQGDNPPAATTINPGKDLPACPSHG